MDEAYNKQRLANIPIQTLKFSRHDDEKESGARQIDFIEQLKDNVELIKVQCALIQVNTSAQGTQSFDLPLNLKKQRGADKARKDSYSTLVLGNWMMQTYFDMINLQEQNVQATFTPMFIN
jgi:hypothetical protein